MKLFISFVLTFSALTLTATAKDDRGRMFNSFDANTTNQFPYVARLEMYWGEDIFYCTGTIIRKDWIVTAAHCVLNNRTTPDTVFIIMGSSQRGCSDEIRVEVPRGNVFAHRNYNATGFIENDIALVRMPPVQTSPNIQIASTNYTRKNYEGQNVTVAGWGKLNMGYSRADKLQYNTFTVKSAAFCNENHFHIVPGQLCLYSYYAATCPGDSGGPALWGKECIGGASIIGRGGCTVDAPIVFTYLPYFSKWINYVIKKYSLPPNIKC